MWLLIHAQNICSWYQKTHLLMKKFMIFKTQHGICRLYEKRNHFDKNLHHWLHWKLSKWQLSEHPMMKISSKRQCSFFSVYHRSILSLCISHVLDGTVYSHLGMIYSPPHFTCTHMAGPGIKQPSGGIKRIPWHGKHIAYLCWSQVLPNKSTAFIILTSKQLFSRP